MVLKLNRNFALLYGIMLGDGCLSLVYGRKKFVVIAGSMQDDVPFFNKIVRPSIKKLINKEIPIKYKPNCGEIQLNFMSKSLFDYFAGFGFPVGKKGDRPFIPKDFYEKRLIKYVLQGFFATDGSLVLTNNNGILYPRVEANGIALYLIKEINTFLNSIGIHSNLYTAKRRKFSGIGKIKQKQYRIQINGKKNLKKFIQKIGFVNPKQIERLQYYYGCTKS